MTSEMVLLILGWSCIAGICLIFVYLGIELYRDDIANEMIIDRIRDDSKPLPRFVGAGFSLEKKFEDGELFVGIKPKKKPKYPPC